MAAPPTSRQSAATFGATFLAATAASIAPTLLSKKGFRQKLIDALWKAISQAKANSRLALLPTLLPIIFRSTQRLIDRHGHRSARFGDNPLVKIFKESLPALLSSPLFLLLPVNFRLQVVLYAISTVLYSFTRPKKPRGECDKEEKERAACRTRAWTVKDLRENWRDYLPPIWTLSCASHAWLLWAFLYEHSSFPGGYSKIIVDHSTRYVPKDRSLTDVLRILGNTDHPKSLWSSPHSYVVCEVLHPAEVSCRDNYFAGLKDETRRAAPWVAAFSALSVIATGKSEFRGRPFRAIWEWIDSTVRGTLYISGTITSAWGMSCLLQRVLQSGFISKGRWLINGAVPSMLIMLLSRSRQVALSMYQFRLALQTAWRVWKDKGGRSIKHGDIMLIGLCWVALIHIRNRSEAGRINGIVGQGMRLVDGTEGQEATQVCPPPPASQECSGSNSGPDIIVHEMRRGDVIIENVVVGDIGVQLPDVDPVQVPTRKETILLIGEERDLVPFPPPTLEHVSDADDEQEEEDITAGAATAGLETTVVTEEPDQLASSTNSNGSGDGGYIAVEQSASYVQEGEEAQPDPAPLVRDNSDYNHS